MYSGSEFFIAGSGAIFIIQGCAHGEPFDQTRQALHNRPDLSILEDSDASCTYCYRGERRGMRAELFGAVLLKPGLLRIDAWSEARYLAM